MLDPEQIRRDRPETLSREDVLSTPNSGQFFDRSHLPPHLQEPQSVELPYAGLYYLRWDDGETVAYYREDLWPGWQDGRYRPGARPPSEA